MRLHRVFLLLVILLGFTSMPAFAQSGDPAVYIVQPGDTLTSVAFRFGIPVDDLSNANNLTDPNSLQPGDQLILPGLEGVHGTLTTRAVALGETLRDISRSYQVSQAGLARLNHVTSPSELYAGDTLIMPLVEEKNILSGRASLAPGESLLELAIRTGSDPWQLQALNGLDTPWAALPGDTLYYPSDQAPAESGIVAPSVRSVEISPLPLVQGKTIDIKITTTQAMQLSGSLLDHDLTFHPLADNSYAALTGINALQEPGLYPLRLSGKQEDGTRFDFEQMILVASGNYYHDPNLIVDPATIDPKTTVPELEQISKIASTVTPDKYWDGLFVSPGYDPNWITSWFGNRRTYNDDPTVSFHTGVDYGGGVGLPIKAPAAGVVVFTGTLTVRGNATIIDHGWGVYSGFWHQSEIDVKVGDRIEPGQVIGLVGGTGRVTGAHLHWEVWVNGTQVEPLDWLDHEYP